MILKIFLTEPIKFKKKNSAKKSQLNQLNKNLNIFNKNLIKKLMKYILANLDYKLNELKYDEVLVVEPEFSQRMSRKEYEVLKVE